METQNSVETQGVERHSSPEPQRAPYLAVIGADHVLVYHRLRANQVVVGRSSESDLQVSVGLSVSRRHVRLRLEPQLLVENLSVRSATWVRGRRLQPGEVAPLGRGEIFECGSVSMFVVWLAESPRPRELSQSGAPLSLGVDSGAAREDETAMQNLLRHIAIVAPSSVSVVLQGETGVGKGWVAQRIHDLSPRRGQQLVTQNCGAVSERLFESEFFGIDKFPGQPQPKPGLFELADRGTLLLDEIGELLPEHQSKLLTVLDTQRVRRVNGTVDRQVDVRVLATTNRDLEAEVAAHRFREDLLARLSTFVLTIPPLRERRGEIGPLAAAFLDAARKRNGAARTSISPEASDWLTAQSWPQNVRQLQKAMERAALLCESGPVMVEHLMVGTAKPQPRVPAPSPPSPQPPQPAVAAQGRPAPPMSKDERLRHETIVALEANYWNVTNAGRHLGVEARTLYYRISKYKLVRPKGPGAPKDEEANEE